MKREMFFRSCLLLLLCGGLLFPLFTGTPAFAQTGTATVRGSVIDPQGRAIPGAAVKLTSTEQNSTRTQTTSSEGGYIFTAVPPGTYRIDVEATGFKKATVTNVRALVDTPSEIPVQLEVGNVNETVTVQSGGLESIVNTTDASIGNTFVTRQITQLPLESRNVVQLLSLQPGVTPSGYVAGSRADQANITLDGVDVNEQQTGLDPQNPNDPLTDPNAAFFSVLRVTPDSIQEFRVTTTNANANQGRSSGAQVSLVTKSGTDQFHGSLYEFHRNTVTTANNFFNNQDGVPRPKLLRNVFGGSLGGPIVKKRLFFFYTYEGRRDAAEQSVLETVPLPSLGQGIIRFPNQEGGVTTLTAAQVNSLFHAVGEDQAALAVLADAARRYPANDTSAGDQYNTGGFRFNAPIKVRLNTHIARFDYNLTRDGKQIVFLRGNYQDDVNNNAPAFPDKPVPGSWSHPYGYVVGHTWTISNNKVNNFRYGLTRLAYSNQGNSTDNTVFFRQVYLDYRFGADQVNSFQRSFSRTTPVHNFSDDFSWVKGNHTFQFGPNIRIIRNRRLDFTNSYDVAYTNFFYYQASGTVLTDPIVANGYTIAAGFNTPVEAAVAAAIGGFGSYTANFNFSRNGNLLPSGTGINRDFATEEYDGYFQDIWKIRPNLTLTYGLRYGYSRPVYETQGYETQPNIPLGEYLRRRIVGAEMGVPYNALITVNLAGPANGGPDLYKPDYANFQPRIALAWEPDIKGGVWRKILGGPGVSVFRGGFAKISEHFGEQLAVAFDRNNTLGFSSSQSDTAGQYNVTTSPPPTFTGFGQSIRNFPGIANPGTLTFPQMQPADMRRRIEASLDSNLQTPVTYSWNATYGRKLPGSMYLEVSYIGRKGRHLLATRDIMTPNDLYDPRSATDWYTAAGMLERLRAAGTPIQNIPNIPYFQNLFGANLGPQLANYLGNSAYQNFTPTQAVYGLVTTGDCTLGNDWTSAQSCIDYATNTSYFYNPQYGALSAFGTIGSSIYHAGTVSLRQRFRDSLTLDFNYTFSKSIDDASGLQTSSSYGSAFILNPYRPQDNRAVSDFDIRHIININGLWQLPIGRGHAFLGHIPKAANAVLGGWQLTGIFRYNSGLPAGAPFDAATWATNWEIESDSVRIRPISTSPTRGGNGQPANLFSDPTYAYQSFRGALPGETGDRNIFRYPGYITLDMGLDKTFTMPWNENHKLQFRAEAFNVTNTQRLTGIADFSTGIDPFSGVPGPTFGNFTSIQGSPRVMQFGLRYTF